MSDTQNVGIQCQSKKSTAVQTKRLSKEELRYYAKIVDKEKQVLQKFIKATKEYPVLRQPHYKINLAPAQTRLRMKMPSRKKRKVKNKVSHKPKGKTDEGNEENTGHYVSKIVVDDDTHSLKLRVRSCHPKKSHELKEHNGIGLPEKSRSRKAKQPRRYIGSLEAENINGKDEHGMEEQFVKVKSSHEPVKKTREGSYEATNKRSMNNKNDLNDNTSPHSSRTPPIKSTLVKYEMNNTDCLFVNGAPYDNLSFPRTLLPTMTSQSNAISQPNPTDEEYLGGQAKSPDNQSTSSGELDYHSPNEDLDDNQSACSEEFVIVENNGDSVDDGKEKANINDVSEDRTRQMKTKADTEEKSTHLENELEKRLNVDKKFENEQNDSETVLVKNTNIIPRNMTMPKPLPETFSVNFYDPQSHNQRVVHADKHISYPGNFEAQDLSKTIDYPKSPKTTVSYPKLHTTLPYTMSPMASLAYPPHLSQRPQRAVTATSETSRPPNLSRAIPPRIPSISYPYASYYSNIPGIPPATNVRAFLPELRRSNVKGRVHDTMPDISSHRPRLIHSITTSGLPSNASVSKSLSTEIFTNSLPTLAYGNISTPRPKCHTDIISARENPNLNTDRSANDVPDHPELLSNALERKGEQGGASIDNCSDVTEIDMQSMKRKRFIFGMHEPPKKKVISSLLTPLCEREATRLADGIHEINMQYFPLRSLAHKAANRVSGDTDDVLKLIDQKIQLKTKIQDVEKARNLLKDIYDMVLKSKEIEDIQNFELVSHNFGVRNILNHLSLVDLYFGELGSELQSKI